MREDEEHYSGSNESRIVSLKVGFTHQIKRSLVVVIEMGVRFGCDFWYFLLFQAAFYDFTERIFYFKQFFL